LALGSLGARHRAAAAQLLLAQIDAGPEARRQHPPALSQLCSREVGVEHLRRVLTDPGATWGYVITAASALARLGPAFHDEAAGHLERVLEHCSRSRYEFVSSLRELANLGEPHRGDAITRMRRALVDPCVAPAQRCSIAGELIRRAPEYHAEAIDELLLIARSERDPEVMATAWSRLNDLGPGLSERVQTELLTLARDDANAQLSNLESVFRSADTANRRVAAEILVAALNDGRRSLHRRLQAAQGLMSLGGAFHRQAVDGVLVLVRAGLILDITYVARVFAATGRGVRSALAQALQEVLCEEHPDPFLSVPAMEALDVLGEDVPVEAMRRLVFDLSYDFDERARVAVMLAKADSAYLTVATSLTFRAAGELGLQTWRGLVAELAGLGVDVEVPLRALATDRDRSLHESMAAACLLGAEGVPLLRKQAEHPYADFNSRSRAYRALVEGADPAVLGAAVDVHLEALRDPGLPVSVRCDAATALVELDRTFEPAVIEVLWRWAESAHAGVDERGSAIQALATVDSPVSPRLARLIIGTARDPEATDELAAMLARKLPRAHRTELERFLLLDQAVEVSHRIPRTDVWDDIPLRAEAEDVIRELLEAPESTAADRRCAATALSRMSVRKDPEAIALLLADGSAAALADAARHGAWQLVHDQAREVVMDEARPMRERRQAALLIGRISDEPSVRDFLLADRDAPWRVRVDELRYAGAFDELRAIRDDPARPPAQRSRAVNVLLMLSLDDRQACARVLAAIAADEASPPALRWRAARDLTNLGVAGRSEGVRLLDAMARDSDLPVGTRADAAAAVCVARPTRRPEMRTVLRGLLPISTPLQRVRVLHYISDWWRDEGLPGLHDMAADARLGPVVRLRAAESIVELRRYHRGFSAGVARELATDAAVPRHVRDGAAMCLAIWSTECREEARALLRRLRDCGTR
jgi:cellulose synthase operon protein C